MAEKITPRPSVMAFAREMEKTLRYHDSRKGGQSNWRNDSADDLIEHAEEELRELKADIDIGDWLGCSGEAVDVANMAMMIWDSLLQLPEATDPASRTE